ncbi:hypothetical protein OIU83_22465 [Flavobacterium sp. LS1R49]|uniref:Lipoprotein n=1 Tax=Flavobacterium shii TaxID=2987687 RepID=A0A9X2ZKF1_9FLAO|nr:hypothetical protein [Flavobacterium shii]MCV9930441.1 hypothetical protein [Flavobacterium shii]
MKKKLSIVCLALIGLTFVSCSNDDDPTQNSNKLNVSASTPGDGQNGQTPIPPPKP